MKRVLQLLFLLSFYLFGFGKVVFAACPAGCTQTAECSGCCTGPSCTYYCVAENCTPGDPYNPCIGAGSCHYTTAGGCTEWSNWSACTGGYQWQSCVTPAGNNDLAVRSCGPTTPPNPTGPGGSSPTPVPPTPIPASCSISIPATITLGTGQTLPVGVTIVNEISGDIDQVQFALPNATIVSLAGAASYLDSTRANGFSANLVGEGGGGPVTLTVTATMVNEGAVCSATSAVTVTNAQAWWQVEGGDVHAGDTAGGVIQSLIPSTALNLVLVRNNVAGYSGVVSAASGGSSINLGTAGATASNPANWRVTNSPFGATTEGYSYDYFERKIPDGCTPTALSGSTINASALTSGGATGGACGGFYWYRYTGSGASINGTADLLNRKVILFAEGGDITLSGDINFNKGVGGFYLFAERNILVAPTVGDVPAATSTPDIEGVLFAEGQVRTGTTGTGGDLQLHIRGGLVGLQGVTLQRNLSNNGLYPAEYLEFGPDLILSWPTSLSRRNLQWREVAP